MDAHGLGWAGPGRTRPRCAGAGSEPSSGRALRGSDRDVVGRGWREDGERRACGRRFWFLASRRQEISCEQRSAPSLARELMRAHVSQLVTVREFTFSVFSRVPKYSEKMLFHFDQSSQWKVCMITIKPHSLPAGCKRPLCKDGVVIKVLPAEHGD